MKFQVPVHIKATKDPVKHFIQEEQIIIAGSEDSVPNDPLSVSKNDILIMVEKVAQILATQGIPCCECPKTQYKLYPLSDCKEPKVSYTMEICCSGRDPAYRFELTISPASDADCPDKQQQTRKEENHD